MSKFFDFCDKKRKILCFGFSLVLFLFLFVPLARASVNGTWSDFPYFVSVFSETWYTYQIFPGSSIAPYYTLRIWRNILSTLFLCGAIVWLFVSCILIGVNKKPRLGVFFAVCLAHFFLFAVKPNYFSMTNEGPLFNFNYRKTSIIYSFSSFSTSSISSYAVTTPPSRLAYWLPSPSVKPTASLPRTSG